MPTAASDLWALGCIIFECATGRPPFAASTTHQLHALVLEAQPQLPPGGRMVVVRLVCHSGKHCRLAAA
jgi:serine/threonine protein kinase